MNIKTEMQEIIKKNLPAEVGEVLKERLAQADKNAIELESKKAQIETLIGNQNALNKRIDEYVKLNERNARLDERENLIEARERQAKVTELEIMLAEANKRADIVVDFTKGLVRNTSFRESVYHNRTKDGYYDTNGVWVNNLNDTTTSASTKDAD